jgi:hypothetical protein
VDSPVKSAGPLSIEKSQTRLIMKEIQESRWRPAELRDATQRLLNEEGVQSGYCGACSIASQWLVDQGFPEEFILPLVEDFHYERDNPHSIIVRTAADGTQRLVSHVRAVSILRVLRALAQVFGVDTTEAGRTWGRKASARILAASIKKAIADDETRQP